MARRPRKAAVEQPAAAVAQTPLDGTIHATSSPDVNALIARHNQLDDFKKEQAKKFAEFMKPVNEELGKIEDQLLVILTRQKADNIACDAGTAYKSTLLKMDIDVDAESYTDGEGNVYKGTEALLYYALDNPDTFGQDGLLIKPQMDAVKRHLDAHEGKPPPGVKIDWWTRVNVRRS